MTGSPATASPCRRELLPAAADFGIATRACLQHRVRQPLARYRRRRPAHHEHVRLGFEACSATSPASKPRPTRAPRSIHGPYATAVEGPWPALPRPATRMFDQREAIGIRDCPHGAPRDLPGVDNRPWSRPRFSRCSTMSALRHEGCRSGKSRADPLVRGRSTRRCLLQTSQGGDADQLAGWVRKAKSSPRCRCSRRCLRIRRAWAPGDGGAAGTSPLRAEGWSSHARAAEQAPERRLT